jgi:hypothetical protein
MIQMPKGEFLDLVEGGLVSLEALGYVATGDDPDAVDEILDVLNGVRVWFRDRVRQLKTEEVPA